MSECRCWGSFSSKGKLALKKSGSEMMLAITCFTSIGKWFFLVRWTSGLNRQLWALLEKKLSNGRLLSWIFTDINGRSLQFFMQIFFNQLVTSSSLLLLSNFANNLLQFISFCIRKCLALTAPATLAAINFDFCQRVAWQR